MLLKMLEDIVAEDLETKDVEQPNRHRVWGLYRVEHEARGFHQSSRGGDGLSA